MSEPRVGHIHFLNVLPLTWGFSHGMGKGLALTRGVPAELNRDIVSHRLDVSPVSSIIYAQHSEELCLLPDFCISSDGAVQSILLISKKPIEALKDDKIILTAKSATSHCLLKIILRRGYGAAPSYSIRSIAPDEPVPKDATASLFIGDDALWLYHHPPASLYCYDLGAEWKTLTGKKMVYAVWVATKAFATESPVLLQLVYDRIRHAFAKGIANKDAAIASVLAETPFTRRQLADYLGSVIRWELTDDFLDGLHTFYALAREMGLIDCVPPLKMAAVRK